MLYASKTFSSYVCLIDFIFTFDKSLMFYLMPSLSFANDLTTNSNLSFNTPTSIKLIRSIISFLGPPSRHENSKTLTFYFKTLIC